MFLFQVRRRHRADDGLATPSLLDAVLEVHLPNCHADDPGGVLYRAGLRGKQLSGLEPADRQHGQPRVAPLVRGGRDSARLRVHPVDSRRGHLSVSSGNSQLSKRRRPLLLIVFSRLCGINIIEDTEPAWFPSAELRDSHGIVPHEPTDIEISLFCIRPDGSEGLCCPTYGTREQPLDEEEE